MQEAQNFDTSYKGWKRDTAIVAPIVWQHFDTSYKGWKRGSDLRIVLKQL